MTMTPQEFGRARREWTGEDNAQTAKRVFAEAAMRDQLATARAAVAHRRGVMFAVLTGVAIAVVYFAIGAIS